jgi:hypothetical protein
VQQHAARRRQVQYFQNLPGTFLSYKYRASFLSIPVFFYTFAPELTKMLLIRIMRRILSDNLHFSLKIAPIAARVVALGANPEQ